MSLGGHCWGYSPYIHSSLSNHCNSFEDQVPADFICGYLAFKWVVLNIFIQPPWETVLQQPGPSFGNDLQGIQTVVPVIVTRATYLFDEKHKYCRQIIIFSAFLWPDVSFQLLSVSQGVVMKTMGFNSECIAYMEINIRRVWGHLCISVKIVSMCSINKHFLSWQSVCFFLHGTEQATNHYPNQCWPCPVIYDTIWCHWATMS